MSVKPDWYRPSGKESFFGPFYYQGDHSREGYLSMRELSCEERTLREVDGVIRLLGLEPSQKMKILDAPCGYGRHLEEFARRGYDVAGVDLCPFFVESARRSLRGISAASVNVMEGELRKLPCSDGSFDVVLNLFYSFGFYADDNDNIQSMAEFARVLGTGGRLLLHTDVNLDRIQSARYDQPLQRNLKDGSLLRIYEDFEPESGRMVGEWEIQTGSNHERRPYSMRVYSLEDYSALCHKVGLTIESYFGSFDPDHDAYTKLSEELIFIARKQ